MESLPEIQIEFHGISRAPDHASALELELELSISNEHPSEETTGVGEAIRLDAQRAFIPAYGQSHPLAIERSQTTHRTRTPDALLDCPSHTPHPSEDPRYSHNSRSACELSLFLRPKSTFHGISRAPDHAPALELELELTISNEHPSEEPSPSDRAISNHTPHSNSRCILRLSIAYPISQWGSQV